MIITILVATVGFAFTLTGAAFIAGAAMPRYGGSRDLWLFPVGLVLFIFGLTLIFIGEAQL